MTPLPRFNLLGIGVHAVDYATATECIANAARQRRPLAATAASVHVVMSGRADREHRVRLNQLDLICPDGQPVRWALNWLHHAGLRDRVYGPFLMLRLCERAAKEGLRIFLYGGDNEVLAALAASLCQRFPGLIIAGTRPGRFSPPTEDEWAKDVQARPDAKPAMVLGGHGCTKQEVWVYEMRRHLDCPLVAVGAAFSLWAGRQPMAPAWMQRSSLEWAFRLCREPRRLWRRYLLHNPHYLAAVLWQKLRPAAQADENQPEPTTLHWS